MGREERGRLTTAGKTHDFLDDAAHPARIAGGCATVALAIYDRATIELDFLKDRSWSAIAALGAATLVTVFVPTQWTQRLWPGWMWVVPLGAAIVTTYYLTPYFTR